MRAIVVVVLLVSTGCSYLIAQKPGPDCVEESGTDLADTTTAVVSGLLALGTSIAALQCLSEGCDDDEEGTQVYLSAGGLIATTVLFGASAIHGSKANDACRLARMSD